MKKVNINKFFKAFIGLITGIIFFEISLKTIENSSLWRIFPVVEPILGEPDKNIGYKFTPYQEGIWLKENRVKVKINSIGIRDISYTDDTKNFFKIVLTGDSMVEALQVSEDYVFENITERNLENFINKDFRIFNLSKSGDGPLRQLVTLEEIGFDLDPDLVIFFSSYTDFLSGELLDDTISPGYRVRKGGNIERSYSFRNRWQIEKSDSRLFKYVLGAIKKSPTLRIIYFKSKEDFKKLLGINKKKVLIANNESDKCFKKEIDRFSYFLKEQNNDLNLQILKYFIKDLKNSTKNEKSSLIYIINSIPIPDKSCIEEILARKDAVNNLNSIFNQNNIKFVDFNYLIKNKFGSLSNSDLKYSGGHLNYLGHQIYSEALSYLIKEFLKENNSNL
tara:strand:- start:606 stop:1781 length:1176 start_codon:yes stop_codon:yes gene_type:complete